MGRGLVLGVRIWVLRVGGGGQVLGVVVGVGGRGRGSGVVEIKVLVIVSPLEGDAMLTSH